MRINVLGVGFDNLTMAEAVDKGVELLHSEGMHYVVTPNPEIVEICRENPEANRVINEADLVLPDGIGVIKGAAMLGTPLKERTPGIEFATHLMGRMAKEGKSLYLLGAKPGVADLAAQKLVETYPGLKIAGTHDGYFKEEGPVVEAINAAKPDALLVCLGAPKQEYFMEEHDAQLEVPVMAGLGGSMDVLAGNVQRAPEFFQKYGLEWLYRLCKEPKRWKRMIKLPLYLWDAVIWRIKGGK